MIAHYRLMLGQGSVHADACFAGSAIGTDHAIHQLSFRLLQA